MWEVESHKTVRENHKRGNLELVFEGKWKVGEDWNLELKSWLTEGMKDYSKSTSEAA